MIKKPWHSKRNDKLYSEDKMVLKKSWDIKKKKKKKNKTKIKKKKKEKTYSNIKKHNICIYAYKKLMREMSD